MNIFKRQSALFILIALCVLAMGCASPVRTSTTTLDETTGIVLVGDQLVGGQLSISGGYSRLIGEDDLLRAFTNQYTVRDSPDQQLERFLVELAPGEYEVSFSLNGANYSQTVFLTSGITKQIRVDN